MVSKNKPKAYPSDGSVFFSTTSRMIQGTTRSIPITALTFEYGCVASIYHWRMRDGVAGVDSGLWIGSAPPRSVGAQSRAHRGWEPPVDVPKFEWGPLELLTGVEGRGVDAAAWIACRGRADLRRFDVPLGAVLREEE